MFELAESKGTVSVVSSDPPCKCLIYNGTLKSFVKYKLDINVYNFENK